MSKKVSESAVVRWLRPLREKVSSSDNDMTRDSELLGSKESWIQPRLD